MAFSPDELWSYKKSSWLVWLGASADLDVNEQVSIFSDAITNIMSNFVLNEKIICDNRDSPWMNLHIKIHMLYKENLYKVLVPEKKNMFHLFNFNNLQNHLNLFRKLKKLFK